MFMKKSSVFPLQVKAVCFDLFFTLADPHCELESTESEPLGIRFEEWNKVAWNQKLSQERGLGILRQPAEIIDRACSLLSFPVSEEQKNQLLLAREARMRLAVTGIDASILAAVQSLKRKGLKIGLISNADVIDRLYWQNSPLCPFFDDVIFSCDVGLLKPDPAIYRLSLEHLDCDPCDAVFVGDGGSSEHKGAHSVGMHTVCTEQLIHYEGRTAKQIRKHADATVSHLSELDHLLIMKQ